MVKVINIDEFNDKELTYTNLFFDNNIIFIEENSELRAFGNNLGIIKYNIISKNADYYRFPANSIIVSCKNSQPVMYYAPIHWNQDWACIQFRKLNCVNFGDKQITSILVEDEKETVPAESRLWNTELFGIDERYAIVFIPTINHKYGQSCFSKMLLIDSQENRSYDVPIKLGKSDSLLRMCLFNASKCKDQTYIMLKTGRMGCYEKKDFWDLQEQNYFDQLESLLILDVNTFIKNIKDGDEIAKNHVVDSCGFEEAFVDCTLDGGQLKYTKVNFSDQSSSFVLYDVFSKQKFETKFDGLYVEFFRSDNEIYAIEMEEEKLYDLMNKQLIYRTVSNEHILDFNNKYAITYLFQEGLKSAIYLHNIKENTVNKLGEGRLFDFDSQRQILTIVD